MYINYLNELIQFFEKIIVNKDTKINLFFEYLFKSKLRFLINSFTVAYFNLLDESGFSKILYKELRLSIFSQNTSFILEFYIKNKVSIRS